VLLVFEIQYEIRQETLFLEVCTYV